MINWLNAYLGTGPYLEVVQGAGAFKIVDVRNLVDKDGNRAEEILAKIDEGIHWLRAGEKVVVCCDYGMSRSNSVAAGIISRYESIPFSQAVHVVQQKIPESGMKLEVLNSVSNAIKPSGNIVKDGAPRILVTGATGFIGRNLIEKLSTKYFVKAVSGHEVDLIQNPVLLDLMIKENGIDVLIHLANPRIYTLNIAMGNSLVMLKNVLEACRLNDIRLFYVSSWEVYSGYRTNELLADENTPLFPKGSYGESKWLSEQLIEHYRKMFNLRSTVLRSTPIYGAASDKPKFIFNFIDKARKNEKIMTHNYLNGSPRLDLLGIEDFISAIEKSIAVQPDGTFNIGSGKLTSTIEIAQKIIKKLNSRSSIGSTDIDSYYSNIRFDCARASRVLRWQATAVFDDFIETLKP